MTESIVVYQKPTCSTCRKVIKLLESQRRAFVAVNYYEEPFTKTKLAMLLKKGGIHATDVLRTKEERYKALQLNVGSYSEEELIELMVQYPDLLQRPLVQIGETVILARPPERLLDFLT